MAGHSPTRTSKIGLYTQVLSLVVCWAAFQCATAAFNYNAEPYRPYSSSRRQPNDFIGPTQCIPSPKAALVNEESFMSVPEVERAISTGSISQTGISLIQRFEDFCANTFSSKYRTIDGSCNNARNLGMSLTVVDRLIPPEYDDDIGSPRTRATDGSPLPSARNVSLHVHPAVSVPQGLTHMVMQWGQWLDHDLTALPVAIEFDQSIRCCGPDGGNPPFSKRQECFPIELPAKEGHFPGVCMEFVRSIPAKDPAGQRLVPREQINSLTAFIDASQVYGSTDDKAEELRDQDSGYLLRTVLTNNGSFPPESEEEDCIKEVPDDYCFFAGDIRVNEQPALGAFHTLFLREHNRIATELRRLRPSDDNEEIFQLARKIVGALQQTITYNEWLPIILGRGMRRYNLESVYGRSTYNPGVDPRVFNAFSTAAFRFGHSLIPERFIIGDRKVPLRQLFNRPRETLAHFDDLLAGLAGLEKSQDSFSQTVDRNFVMEITKFLFIPEGGASNSGLDLISLNIQRGRDHGIPPYTKYRALCGLRPLTGFNDTEALGPFVSELAKVYNSVHDIDLFTGLVHEPIIEGIVGPTLNCLIGIQFFRAKFGDRFFFDTDDRSLGFTNAQLRTIRATTLANVICWNTNIEALPPNVFSPSGQYTGYDNGLVPCSELNSRALDLRLFRKGYRGSRY